VICVIRAIREDKVVSCSESIRGCSIFVAPCENIKEDNE
jgi:hypothetical protein